MSKEAMKLALEALENGKRVRNAEGGTKYQPDIEDKAITALREALAEQPAQQQEPKLPEFYARFEDGLVSVYQRREDATPLLLLRENLPDKQPAHLKPVGRLESDPDEGHVFVPRIDGDWSMLGKDLYTSPPAQRTWVGLTDEDWKQIFLTTNATTLPRAIEAKLKEKNT